MAGGLLEIEVVSEQQWYRLPGLRVELVSHGRSGERVDRRLLPVPTSPGASITVEPGGHVIAGLCWSRFAVTLPYLDHWQQRVEVVSSLRRIRLAVQHRVGRDWRLVIAEPDVPGTAQRHGAEEER
ncbi:MAG: hypothetical protein R2710_31470 [Acidimicrobiales bacterium]